MNLLEMIDEFTERSACGCGACPAEETGAPQGAHTVNLVFFELALTGEVARDEFVRAVEAFRDKRPGCNPFDGTEHSYLELGRWLDDQQAAIRMMGMGALLGAWDLLTPHTEFGPDLPNNMALQMAQSGLLAIQVRNSKEDG